MIKKIWHNIYKTLQKSAFNFWSVFSLIYILCWFLLMIFAYFIIPDKTKHANQGNLLIASQPPGFRVLFFNDTKLKTSFLDKWVGAPISSETYPIRHYTYTNDSIKLELFNQNPLIKTIITLPNKNKYQAVENQINYKTFWLGTDKAGRDYLSRLVLGARVSLSIGFVAVLISLFIGLFFGTISGYYGGKTDTLVMWIINVAWSIPTLLMVIAITLSLGKGIWQVFLAVGLTMWVEVARIVRGQILSIKTQPYITAAKALGLSDIRIVLKHIYPNILGPVIVVCTANFASAILVESGLSFLGLGAQPPLPSWGSMIKDYYADMILGRPYLALAPGTAIMTTVLAFMMLGNGLRDYFYQSKK